MEEEMCGECPGEATEVCRAELSHSDDQEVAGRDLFKLGIEVISFTLKDITDEEEYLTSLGRLSIAAATRDAAIGVAEENRDIAIKTVECHRETKVVQIRSRAAIEAMVRDANMKAASYHQETQRALAIRDLAEELEKCKQAQKMKAAEMMVEVVVRRKQVEIEEREIARSEAALVAEVKLPTEAEAYRVR